MRASLSRSIILGVVPEATSAWNPEIAPQAIVMNANGNSFPAKTGPSPSVAKGVSAGMRSGGGDTRSAPPRASTVVILREGEGESGGDRRLAHGGAGATKPYASIHRVEAAPGAGDA